MKCYYEELGLTALATSEEINKAYKKLALKYHPDKNVDNAENAKMKFLDIQKAYKVLSDPHERAWYDRNKDVLEAEEHSGNFVHPSSYHNTYVFKDYDDSADGFYTVYRELFQSIVQEELLFDKTKSVYDYPVFGYSDSDFETVVKPFYVKWSIFQTKKTFSWTDEISEQEGANRQEVRHIKKLNAKNRQQQIKQYNESVRSLVLFLKKRDKRIPKKSQETKQPSKPIKGPQSSTNKSNHRPPINVDWQTHYDNILGDLNEIDSKIDEFLQDSSKNKLNNNKFDGLTDETIESIFKTHGGYTVFDESEALNIKFIHCMICDKSFKVMANYLSHIKSKKHLSNLKILERERNYQKYLDENFFTPPTSESETYHFNESEDQKNEEKKIINDSDASDHCIEDEETVIHDETTTMSSYHQSNLADIDTKDEDNSVELENKSSSAIINDTIITKDDIVNGCKRKNKIKKKKKPPKNDSLPSNNCKNNQSDDIKMFVCQICHEKFPSNTKLFNHIKDKGHAALKDERIKNKKKKK